METSTLRKPLHILLVLAMTASLLATAAVGSLAQTFNDVDEDNRFFLDIEAVNANGILTGFEDDNTFRPGLNLTRRAAAAVIFRLADEPEGDFASVADLAFTDRDGTGQFDNDIGWATQQGIISGFEVDNTFRAGLDVSRAAFAVWLYGLQGSPDDQDYAQIADDAFEDRDGSRDFDAAIGWASDNEIITGFVEGDTAEYRGGEPITRRAVAAMANRYFNEFGKGFVEPVDPEEPIEANPNLTEAPELLEVTRDGDIVTFTFSDNVPGKALDFINTAGDPGSLQDGDDVSYYTGLRLYDPEGTAYYPSEAGIFGNQVRARYVSPEIVAGATLGAVYEDTVQTAGGFSNPAGSFPLMPSTDVDDPTVIPPYFPQLTFTGDLRTTDVTPAEILVDFDITFASNNAASSALASISSSILATESVRTDVAEGFAIVGSAGQIYRGVDLEGADPDGDTITVTVQMDPAIEELPVSQLRRGFIEEDNFSAAGLAHMLISTAYQDIEEVNGTTTDPDLRAVERGPGANQMRFIFDEAVSVPDTPLLNNPELYTVTTNDEGQRTQATTIGRSLIEADGATVMIATFDNYPMGDFDNAGAFLEEVVAASVNVGEYVAGTANTVIAESAARATDQVASQQLGWAAPAQVLVTPVQPAPPVPGDVVAGRTSLADLESVTKTQNEVTGNWRVTFTFDSAVGGVDLDFSLYDDEGVRFSNASRDITATANEYSFGPDVEGTTSPTFTNEQIEASVLGTVQDSDADLVSVGDGTLGGTTPSELPGITERGLAVQ